jgi:endonuclease YncB( thermonuclease family)
MIGVLVALILTMSVTPMAAAEIAGPAEAVDSTVIEINGQRVMLFGIDSVMRKQTCTIDGKIWQCWRAAVRDLQTLLEQGPAVCEAIGEPDVYGRLLARCTINGESLNELLVQRGYAVARPSESSEYVAAEGAAREKKLGLWQGQFLAPSQFRRAAGIFVDRP